MYSVHSIFINISPQCLFYFLFESQKVKILHNILDGLRHFGSKLFTNLKFHDRVFGVVLVIFKMELRSKISNKNQQKLFVKCSAYFIIVEELSLSH